MNDEIHKETALLCPDSGDVLVQKKYIMDYGVGERSVTITLSRNGVRHAMCMPAYIKTVNGKRVTEVWYKDGKEVEVPAGYEDMDKELKQFTWAML